MLSLFNTWACILCGAPRHVWCDACRARSLQARTPQGLTVACLGPYSERLAALVKRFKYGQETALARPLGRSLGILLNRSWSSLFSQATHADPCAKPIYPAPNARLVPVPLHVLRLAERGYNQSALLARAASRPARVPVDFTVLQRSASTSPQARLGRRQRLENVASAFHSPAKKSKRETLSYLLVDDVMTTGSTLDAAAHALRLEGYVVLGALCLAHKPAEPSLPLPSSGPSEQDTATMRLTGRTARKS